MSVEKNVELLEVHSREDIEQVFHYSAGKFISKFLVEMRDNKKIIGIKCPKCGLVFAPPKEVCDDCYVEMTEPVEVENVGTIINCTTLHFPFVDPETGVQKEVPYSFGNIKLDGADSLIQNYLVADDMSKIKVGARVEIEFQEERVGSLRDIACFRITD